MTFQCLSAFSDESYRETVPNMIDGYVLYSSDQT